MKKTAIAAALMMIAGGAQAFTTTDMGPTTHTMTDGNFDFYDSSGAYQAGFSHSDVQGEFNMVDGLGSFSTSTPFSGDLWEADINAMWQWGGTSGSGTVETHNYTWTTNTYFTGTEAITCRVSGAIDGCVDNGISTAGYTFLGSSTQSYTFDLSEGQFAAGVFFDWSGNEDIPVMAVLQVTGVGGDGSMDVVSVDSDGDGVPGTAMVTPPFPGQTPAFSGTITPVPVPAAVWLFGSGLIGLAGIARRRKAA